MYIYSGTCRMGNCGEKTKLTDIAGKELYVGDIVLVLVMDEMRACDSYRLSAIVSDRWETYNDKIYKEKEGDVEYFVMGIKSIDFMDKDSDKWLVKKVKDWSDCVDGEHWREFGFSYREE